MELNATDKRQTMAKNSLYAENLYCLLYLAVERVDFLINRL